MSDHDIATKVENRLMSHGVYIDVFEETDSGGVYLEYESLYAEEGVIPHREVGRVINVFLDLHDDDWTGADIEAVVTDSAGEPAGSWSVEQEWVAKLNAGELSETDFSARVIETIST